MRWLIAATAACMLVPHAAQAQIREWPYTVFEAPRYAPRTPYVQPEAPRTAEPPFERSTVREAIPITTPIPGKLIVVFVRSQQYSAFVDGRMAYFGEMPLRGPVTTGDLQHMTPVTDPAKGAHAIDKRPGDRDYVSKTYPEATEWRPAGGAKMPFAMFFDRPGGYALHAGYIPKWEGYPFGVSHGCVRLPSAHAEALFLYFSDPDVRVIIAADVATFIRKWEGQYLATR